MPYLYSYVVHPNVYIYIEIPKARPVSVIPQILH